MALLLTGFPATAGPLITLGPIASELDTLAGVETELGALVAADSELLALAGVETELSGIALLSDDFAQDVKLRTTGKTIGGAGELFFGVGPAIKSGAPDGISVNDYFPTHAASGSFM